MPCTSHHGFFTEIICDSESHNNAILILLQANSSLYSFLIILIRGQIHVNDCSMRLWAADRKTFSIKSKFVMRICSSQQYNYLAYGTIFNR